jgi:hypothetical protein
LPEVAESKFQHSKTACRGFKSFCPCQRRQIRTLSDFSLERVRICAYITKHTLRILKGCDIIPKAGKRE